MTRFKVDRASCWDYEIGPCEEAFRTSEVVVDCRCVDDPAKVKAEGGKRDWWYNAGTNHRVVDGWICRDMGYEVIWCVEIETLEGLMAFEKKYGKLIVYGANPFGSLPLITIYDDYVE